VIDLCALGGRSPRWPPWPSWETRFLTPVLNGLMEPHAMNILVELVNVPTKALVIK
jgi:hypothetical protein